MLTHFSNRNNLAFVGNTKEHICFLAAVGPNRKINIILTYEATAGTHLEVFDCESILKFSTLVQLLLLFPLALACFG